jgi:hypothetical protein
VSTPKVAAQPTPIVTDVAEALAEVEKSQRLAGHFPDSEDLDLARRILAGELSAEESRAEILAKLRGE